MCVKVDNGDAGCVLWEMGVRVTAKCVATEAAHARGKGGAQQRNLDCIFSRGKRRREPSAMAEALHVEAVSDSEDDNDAVHDDVEDEEDEVGALGEPADDALKVVLAPLGLLLPCQHTRRVDQRHVV